MIPKTIHYCWFGRNKKTKLAEKCIKSWKKYCPDYEIIEWNEDNFDIFAAPLYVRQAYEVKKWAFVTDYVRLWAMVNYGGIYMDTDVEVIKPLEPFLMYRAFSGFESEKTIPTGIMASEKDFPLFQELLRYYDDAYFINTDGTFNLTTNVVIITDICKERGLMENNSFQIIDDFALYPKEFFCPIDNNTCLLKKTRNTVAIHWFAGSWLEKEQRKKAEAFKKANQRDYLIHIPNRLGMKMLGIENYNKIKKILGMKK